MSLSRDIRCVCVCAAFGPASTGTATCWADVLNRQGSCSSFSAILSDGLLCFFRGSHVFRLRASALLTFPPFDCFGRAPPSRCQVITNRDLNRLAAPEVYRWSNSAKERPSQACCLTDIAPHRMEKKKYFDCQS